MQPEGRTKPVWIIPVRRKLPAPQWIQELAQQVQPVVVLDGVDGDVRVLEAAGALLVRHAVPLGVGRALKSGLNAALTAWPDCPGALLSAVEDELPPAWIAPMVASMEEASLSLSLGMAELDDKTPREQARARRREARLFSLINGAKLEDVRPALRAAPAALLPRLAVARGEGEDYLLNMVFQARTQHVPLKQVPLPPCAVEQPGMSLVQWFSMVWTLVRFLLSSLTAFVVDYGCFTLLYLFVSKSVALCTVGARIISSLVNYMINRRMVFRAQNQGLGTLVRYYALVAALLTVNVLLLKLLDWLLPLPVLVLKPLVEACVYGISFWLQRDVVFRVKTGRDA